MHVSNNFSLNMVLIIFLVTMSCIPVAEPNVLTTGVISLIKTTKGAVIGIEHNNLIFLS